MSRGRGRVEHMFTPFGSPVTAVPRPGRRIAPVPSGRRTYRSHAALEGGPARLAREDSSSYVATDDPDPSDAPGDPSLDPVEQELARLSAGIAALLPRIPEEAPGPQVDAWFAALKRLDGASSAIRVRLISCLQRSRTSQDAGHSGPPSYLREHLGLSGREASKQDSLARDLRHLPGTAAALAAGDIGPEQAGAIGQASRRGVLGTPAETEGQLLPVARDGSSDGLRRHIRDAEHRADRDSLRKQERRQQALRSASLNRRSDGMWELYARLPSEPGEQFAVALEAFRTPDPPDTPEAEQRSSDKRTADALSDLIRATLQGGVPITGGVRPQLNVTIPIELLTPGAPGAGTTDHGGVLSGEAVQRLSCDADVRWILTRGSTEVLDVGRTSYRWTRAQRRALVVRDGGCRGPGCDRPPAWCDAHHIQWWSQDGPTSLDNGLLLCRRHHRLVHDDGWSLEHDAQTGRATFTSPAGREVTTWPHRITPADDPLDRSRRSPDRSAAESGQAPAAEAMRLPEDPGDPILRIQAGDVSRDADPVERHDPGDPVETAPEDAVAAVDGRAPP